MRDQRESSARGARREALRDSIAIALVALVPLALLRPLQNAPFVDDWTYAWSVETLVRGGGLELLEWSTHPNVVQIVWGALFCLPWGFSFTALRASTWVLATSGLVALYLLLRELGIARRDALIGTATLGVNPIFFVLSFTFMTDVPFFALGTWSMLAMARALTRRSEAWLAAAALAAGLAIGVRLVGAVLPVAMALTLLFGSGKMLERPLEGWGRHARRLAIAVAPLLLLGALLLWRTAHVHVTADIGDVGDSPAVRVQRLSYALPRLPVSLIEALGAVANVLGIGLLPLVVASFHRGLVRRSIGGAAAIAMLLALGALGGAGYDPPLVTGSTWALRELGATEALVPGLSMASGRLWSWMLLPVALLSGGQCLATLVRHRRRTAPQTFLAWVALGHFLLIAVLWLYYDRHLLVLAVPVLALVLSRQPVRRPGFAVALLAAIALLSILGTRDHLAYSRALWQAVEELRSAGASDAQINAGYVVNGWLQYTRPENAPRGPDGAPRVPWINSNDQSTRYWVANSPVPGYETLWTIAYDRWLAPSGRIFILERHGPGLPS